MKGLSALVAVATMLAGCGGGTGASKTTAGTRPEPKEPLSAAAHRLERALPRRDCKELIGLMLHSVQRGGTAPDAPPTKRECAYVKTEAANQLRGFHVTKVSAFGPAGFAEGSGRSARPGFVIGVVWLLDSDGSWKAGYQATYRPQIGVPPRFAAQADANARRLLAAVKAGNCAELWRVLNVVSRFVRTSAGQRDRFCRTLPATYRDAKTAFAQIKAGPAPTLETLGRTRDFAFYGVRLANGRYLDLVLSGPLANIAPRELPQHDNPSVLEFVTVRPAR
jgi:hypothetical protein